MAAVIDGQFRVSPNHCCGCHVVIVVVDDDRLGRYLWSMNKDWLNDWLRMCIHGWTCGIHDRLRRRWCIRSTERRGLCIRRNSVVGHLRKRKKNSSGCWEYWEKWIIGRKKKGRQMMVVWRCFPHLFFQFWLYKLIEFNILHLLFWEESSKRKTVSKIGWRSIEKKERYKNQKTKYVESQLQGLSQQHPTRETIWPSNKESKDQV